VIFQAERTLEYSRAHLNARKCRDRSVENGNALCGTHRRRLGLEKRARRKTPISRHARAPALGPLIKLESASFSFSSACPRRSLLVRARGGCTKAYTNFRDCNGTGAACARAHARMCACIRTDRFHIVAVLENQCTWRRTEGKKEEKPARRQFFRNLRTLIPDVHQRHGGK